MNSNSANSNSASVAGGRGRLVVGNWKMNGDAGLLERWCGEVGAGLVDVMADAKGGVEVVVCPPFTLLAEAGRLTRESLVKVGGQDMDVNEGGAFTGQVSGRMLVECGCGYVIVGHSERRAGYGDSDALVGQKAKVAVAAGLVAIVCVGETGEQREAGETEEVVGLQLRAVSDAVGGEAFAEKVVVAYEPVWAIGSGVAASAQQAQDVHRFIRARLVELDGRAGEKCRILYGGSVKADNAGELLSQADIDGALVGGASLTAGGFLGICRGAVG